MFDFLRIFFVFVNMVPHGSENFKTLLLPHITSKSFLTSPNFPSNGPHKTTFGIFENVSFPFLTIFFFSDNFKFTIVAYGEIKKPQLSGK